MTQILQDRLAHDLGPPIHTLSFERRRLRNRNDRGNSIYCSTARVDHPSAFVRFHGLGQQNRRRQVVRIVSERDLARLPYSLVCLRNMFKSHPEGMIMHKYNSLQRGSHPTRRLCQTCQILHGLVSRLLGRQCMPQPRQIPCPSRMRLQEEHRERFEKHGKGLQGMNYGGCRSRRPCNAE